jgi:hypothetical protein
MLILSDYAVNAEAATNSPLHFHFIKDPSGYEVSEVAESSRPEIIALDSVVLYSQSASIFPSWTLTFDIP